MSSFSVSKLPGYDLFIELKRRFFSHDEEKLSDIEFVGQGFIKGFLLWFAPLFLSNFAGRATLSTKRAFAVGTFVASIRALSRLENKIGPSAIPEVLSKYASALKFVFSSILFVSIDQDILNNTLVVFWVLVRALYHIVPVLPFGSTISMCVSASWLLSSWIMSPTDLNRTYDMFLCYQGGIRLPDRAYAIHRGTLPMPGIGRPCFVMHPHVNCQGYAREFFIDSLVRAATIYIPLHFTFFILTKNKSIPNLLENVIRSMLFLASYCTLGWYSACFFCRFWNKGVTRWTLATHTWVAGLSTLLERPSRRTELAIYCMTYTLDSMLKTFKNQTKAGKGFIFPSRLVLLLSMGVLGHYYQRLPSFLVVWLLRLKPQIESQEDVEK